MFVILFVTFELIVFYSGELVVQSVGADLSPSGRLPALPGENR